MKKILQINLLLCSIFLAFACDNEGDNHSFITIKNQSEIDVYVATKGLYPYYDYAKCFMDSITILKRNNFFKYYPYRTAIERNLRNGEALEFFIVNPNRFNNKNEFYDCDSIAIKNDILMHYRLTLKDLKHMNWEIIYKGN